VADLSFPVNRKSPTLPRYTGYFGFVVRWSARELSVGFGKMVGDE